MKTMPRYNHPNNNIDTTHYQLRKYDRSFWIVYRQFNNRLSYLILFDNWQNACNHVIELTGGKVNVPYDDGMHDKTKIAYEVKSNGMIEPITNKTTIQ